MPAIVLERLRRLRADAKSLFDTLDRDLALFRHSQPNHGFRRTPTSESLENDVGVTTTCSCLMALALADKLDAVYGQEKGRDMGAAIFEKLLKAPWMSSGLPENNAFTTTLVLRLFLLPVQVRARRKRFCCRCSMQSSEIHARWDRLGYRQLFSTQ